MIQDKKDLRFKYEILLLLNRIKNENESVILDMESYNDSVKEIKKEIRDYYKEIEKERKEWLIRDDGIDGCIVLFELPSEINSVKQILLNWQKNISKHMNTENVNLAYMIVQVRVSQTGTR